MYNLRRKEKKEPTEGVYPCAGLASFMCGNGFIHYYHYFIRTPMEPVCRYMEAVRKPVEPVSTPMEPVRTPME